MKRYVRSSEARKLKAKQAMIDKGYAVYPDGEFVHRRVCREHWGKFPSNWHVHHIDHSKLNNAPSNLIALPKELHKKVHQAYENKGYRMGRAEIEILIKGWKGLRAVKKLNATTAAAIIDAPVFRRCLVKLYTQNGILPEFRSEVEKVLGLSCITNGDEDEI